MNGFWLDFLKTPMAAPETPGLRMLRMSGSVHRTDPDIR